MNIDAVTAFVANVRVHFAVDKMTAEQEGNWVRSLATSIGKFPPDVIKQAARQIIDTRKYKTFPLPADIIEVCEGIEAVLKRRELAGKGTALQSDIDTWSRERQRVAYDVCRSGLGRQAAREGWVLRLWHFARVEQRPPQPLEADRLRREAKEHKQLVAQCHAGVGFPPPRPPTRRRSTWQPIADGKSAPQALAELGDSMLAREDRLAGEVLG